jgi:hypothetical protein
LVISQDAITGFALQDDASGMYRFRVFERIQFVVRDRRALLRLEFQDVPVDEIDRDDQDVEEEPREAIVREDEDGV